MGKVLELRKNDHLETASCSSMLRAELMLRCQRNKHYSARAFARDLGVSPSYLTQLLNGSRTFNERLSAELTVKLGWPDRKVSLFITLAQRENARTPELRKKFDQIIAALHTEEEDFFSIKLEHDFVIANWRHGAILELTEFPNFESDSRWIARKLGMTLAAAEVAIERLIGLGYLFRDNDGRLSKSHNHTTTPDVNAACIRKRHLGLLEEAVDAVRSQPLDKRDFSSIIMAIDPAKITEAKEKIEKFRRDLMGFLESGDRRELYQLSVQLFRLDRIIEDNQPQADAGAPPADV